MAERFVLGAVICAAAGLPRMIMGQPSRLLVAESSATRVATRMSAG